MRRIFGRGFGLPKASNCEDILNAFPVVYPVGVMVRSDFRRVPRHLLMQWTRKCITSP